jgi:hypothetical protein
MFAPWLAFATLAATCGVTSAYLPAPLTLLKDPNAKCLDGTPAYVRYRAALLCRTVICVWLSRAVLPLLRCSCFIPRCLPLHSNLMVQGLLLCAGAECRERHTVDYPPARRR